ncbi:hypothetical protein [Methanotorris igneus]|uniref:hypothetical protein n=1 Tax=Methanotorris igneus TaxID=2189 RepID=UPI0012F6955A|nr:hypothetical protein [Methanotorris igneus]
MSCKFSLILFIVLDIIEKEEDFETQLLSHELLVKSLVETILIEENRQRNKK